MEKLKLKKADGNIVSCIREIPDNPKGIVVAVHGFTSSKECPTYQGLLGRLPAAGFGMIGIDLPGHGVEESAQELLRIPGALDSIKAAEEYAASHFPDLPICYFASSFGAYLTGIYISTIEHKGRRAFFRSAAVNMPTLFIKENPSEEEKRQLADLEEKGYFDTSMDLHRPVRITKEMYRDLMETDLFECFAPDHFGPHKIAMAHGAQDNVIDPEAAKEFARRFQIPLTLFDGEGHSLAEHPGTADRVIDLAIALYEER